jgi:transglutaminase-like putative cysteine protease
VSTLAAPAPVVREGAGGPALPLAPVRGLVLLCLAVFGGLHWMWMFDPAEPGRAWLATAIAAGVVLALLGAARLPGLLRPLAAALIAVAGLALALLAGGVADEELRPERWDSLLGRIGRGVEALPGVNVPYRGVDEATMLALGVGGTVLAVAAAVLAFWPRSGGRTGFRPLALLLLVTLYAVPAVVLDFEGEFIRGALLALLVLAFLRLERLPVGDVKAAGIAAAVAAIAALAAAPVLDGREPWWDYEAWAVDTATAREVGFSWEHDYSPLDWPRDGREMLRVKARQPAYWKAQDLDLFDGNTWRVDPRVRSEAVTAQLPSNPVSRRTWFQEIEVTLRNLRSSTFITAGIATAVRGPASYPLGGGVFAAPDGLGKGDTYTADVYTPRPTERQLRTAPADYEDAMRRYLSVIIPPTPSTDFPALLMTWPGFADPGEPVAVRLGDVPFEQAVDRSGLRRIWTLAQELKAGTETPYEYLEAVEAFLGGDFSYSETPPEAARTLDGFLFDARIGFCQQFSGAEALLLRMGGVPARVATGFTSGSFDEQDREYVVRDFDAHSWVEVWFPGYGWVQRDPTPATAPPRNQPGENRGASAPGGLPGAPSLGGERLSQLDEGRAVADDDGLSPLLIAVLALAGAGLLGALVLEWRRRRRLPPPAARPMAEFERALRRARYDRGEGLTLTRMERRFAGWPGAAGYVRALREQRYSGGSPVAPTPEQRRGLRAALARDAGLLRSWWALPPRLRWRPPPGRTSTPAG